MDGYLTIPYVHISWYATPLGFVIGEQEGVPSHGGRRLDVYNYSTKSQNIMCKYTNLHHFLQKKIKSSKK